MCVVKGPGSLLFFNLWKALEFGVMAQLLCGEVGLRVRIVHSVILTPFPPSFFEH